VIDAGEPPEQVAADYDLDIADIHRALPTTTTILTRCEQSNPNGGRFPTGSASSVARMISTTTRNRSQKREAPRGRTHPSRNHIRTPR
jgi:hypothetical protein